MKKEYLGGSGHNSLRQFLSMLLCLVMILSLVPANYLRAAEKEEGTEPVVPTDQIEVVESGAKEESMKLDNLPDSDELFAGYVNKKFGIEDEDSRIDSGKKGLRGSRGENVLDGQNLSVYHVLKSKIAEIAAGDLSSTVICIPLEDLGIGERYTLNQLKEASERTDLDSLLIESGGKMAINPDASNALRSLIKVDLAQIMGIIRSESPYELYWFGNSYTPVIPGVGYYSYGNEEYLQFVSGDGDNGVVCYKIMLLVSADYSKNGGLGEYETDTEKTGAATQAANNAQTVVEEYDSKSDYNKLRAYKNYICDQVSYNYDAAYDPNAHYGDPWQLIYVFDKKADTNVVCEGYAKAFQYLCDKSTFNESISVGSVTGDMEVIKQSGTSGGGHMWNTVRIGNPSTCYLVDVTNCDSGSIGYPEELFMVGHDESRSEHGIWTPKNGGPVEYDFYAYTVNIEGQGSIKYSYDYQTMRTYEESQLVLSPSDYGYGDTTPSISVMPTNLSMEVGTTKILTATIKNVSNPSITWTSTNPSVATVVDTTGEVTGVAEGTTTITATMTVDGTSYTDSCFVKVKPEQVYNFTSEVYVLTDTLEAGQEYLIVNANAPTNKGKVLFNGTQDIYIYEDSEADLKYITVADVNKYSLPVWTSTEVENGKYTLKNGDSYLDLTAGNWLAGNSSGGYWSYDNNNLAFVSENSTQYLSYNSGNFVSSDSPSRGIYLYRKIGTAGVGVSLTVSDSIRINLKIRDLTDTDISKYSVWYKYGDEIKKETLRPEMEYNGNYSFVVANCTAKEMMNRAYFKLFYGEDCIYNGSYSIRDYCTYKIDTSKNEDLVSLCRWILDYGSYAQDYFNYHTDNLANQGEYGNGLNAVNNLQIPSDPYANYTYDIVDNALSVNISLSLASNIEMNYKISCSDPRNLVFCGITSSGGESVESPEPDESPQLCVRKITGIPVRYLHHYYTLTFKNGEGEQINTISVSPLTYAYHKQNGEKIGPLCKALYMYWLYANKLSTNTQ